MSKNLNKNNQIVKKAMVGIAIAGSVAAPVSNVFAATPTAADEASSTAATQVTTTQTTGTQDSSQTAAAQTSAPAAQASTSTVQTTSTASSASTASTTAATTAPSSTARAATTSQPAAQQTSTATTQTAAPRATTTATTASQPSASTSTGSSQSATASTPKAATASTASNTGSTASQGTTGSSTSTASTVSVPKQTADSAKNTSDQYNTSAKTYNDAKQNYETAKNNAQKASDEKDAATKQKEAADKKLADAKKDVSSKTDAVKTAENNVSTANDALSKAKKDVDSAKADVTEKQAAFDQAKAAYDKAKAVADEKDNVLSDAQNKLDAMQKGSLLEKAQKELTDAQNAEDKAQDTYDSAKTKADNAKDTLDSAKAAKESAANQVTDAQKAADDASTKAEDAQKALDEAQKNWDEAGKKFIESHLDANQTFDAFINLEKEIDAKDNNEYAKFLTDSHFTEALNRALRVENLEKDADYIEECNELRAKNGFDPLLISYSGMQEAAMSAAQISVAANVYGIFGHVGYSGFGGTNSEGCKSFPQLENAAWGCPDPYDGWYTAEQQYVNFLCGMTGEKTTRPTEKQWTETECRDFLKNYMGWSETQINDYFKEVPYGKMTYKQECDFMNSNGLATGHYNAMLSNEVFRTGIAFIDDEADIYEQSLGYGITTIQEFYGTEFDNIWVDGKPKAVPHVQTDTPAAFKQKLQDFTKDLKDKLAKAKQALADAQTAQAKANEKLDAAQTALTEADASYADAQAKVKAADQAYTDAQNALNAAKAKTADKQQAYNDALNAEKDRAEAIKAQQKAVEAARQDKAAAHQALAAAENAKNTANQNLTAAKQAQAKADKAYQDANTKVNDTTKALNTAKGALKISQDHQSTAQVEADTALANETAKIEAFKNAQGLEKEAYDAYKKSGDDLVAFVNDHINALPDTDSLTLNDRDDVDTMSKIAEAVPSELKDSLDTDSLAKLDSAKQKMADLILIQKDKDAAKAVADKVNALPEEITADNASDVYNAQKAYNKLSDRQKDYAGQDVKDKIDAAVSEADKAMAQKVTDAINALPENITLDDQAKVMDAFKMYEALTPAAKKQVDTTKLEKAEKALKAAQEAKRVKDLENMIKALPKNVTAKNARSVHNLMVLYNHMSPSEKAKVNKSLVAKLYDAYRTLSNPTVYANSKNSSAKLNAKAGKSAKNDTPQTGENGRNAAAAAGAAGIAGAAVLVAMNRKKRINR